jgi:hypothetical protein
VVLAQPAAANPTRAGETQSTGDVNAAPIGKSRPNQTLPAAVVTVAFPLSLAALVVVFLLFQGRLDSRDPRLLLAPLDGGEQLGFS